MVPQSPSGHLVRPEVSSRNEEIRDRQGEAEDDQ